MPNAFRRRAGRYVRAHSGQRLLEKFFRSVMRHHGNAQFTILSTPATKLPDFPFPVKIVTQQIDQRLLLYERMRHCIFLLEGARDDCAYLFLENDLLMLQRLSLDIEEDWDVALAYKSTGMCINSGMFLVWAYRREPAVAFLRQALELYEERYLDHPKWGSDQAALRDALGLREPTSSPRAHVTNVARTAPDQARVHAFCSLVRQRVSAAHLDTAF